MRHFVQKHDGRIIAGLVLLAALLAMIIPRIGETESTSFRAGDVGFSMQTPGGEMWVYGDSWINGRFIRNAITLNGQYRGTLRDSSLSGWIWPGVPIRRSDGKILMYASQHQQAAAGMWGTKRIQTLKIVFDPAHPEKAQITPMGSAPAWSATSLQYRGDTLVYGVDQYHRSRVGYLDLEGNLIRTERIGALISGRYSVVQDGSGRWWTVGFLPWLSRRLVAYPMKDPTHLKSTSYRLLQTLPAPPAGWFVYDGLVHPELGGLLTWAENGKGPGGWYGLNRKPGFWPGILQGDPASRIAAAITPWQPLVGL